jgi:hypothetical protein
MYSERRRLGGYTELVAGRLGLPLRDDATWRWNHAALWLKLGKELAEPPSH